MNTNMLILISFVSSLGLNILYNNHFSKEINVKHNLANFTNPKYEQMKLGAFSVSLSVKDIHVSKQFYENLGFQVFAGDIDKNYLIMKNESTIIGLFQGMFENNILTFNPGWDENAQNLAEFVDVRDIQKNLKSKGISMDTEVDETNSGPGSFVINDPDGNTLLFDQHR